MVQLKDWADYSVAIVRTPGSNAAAGLATSRLGQPNPKLLQRQHQDYVTTLKSLGLRVEQLPSLQLYPDGWFVEDVAVITPEIAVITQPGAAVRRGEVDYIVAAIGKYRPINRITGAGRLDGGDVLIVDHHCMVGLSQRTNLQGAQQLAALLEPYGYRVSTIELSSGLHLKSSVNFIDQNTLLVSEAFATHPKLHSYEKIVVSEHEKYAANSVRVNGVLLIADGFSGIAERLQTLAYDIIVLDVSEVQKMDGGLTCMSLRFV